MIPEARVAVPVTESEAIRLARQIFGLPVVSAQSLPGEYDDNFHLKSSEGRELVLKVMHPARDASFVEMQCQALQHLEQRAPHLSLPRVFRAKDGNSFTTAALADGSNRLVWLLSYLPGTVLAKANPRSAELLHSLGAFLGEMDAAFIGFSHAGAHRELKWDLSQPGWIREFLTAIADPMRRALVEHFLALYESDVVPVLPSLRRSVLYGDANDYNVLVSAPLPQPRRVVGVIDFGDMHHGITVSEVAIGAAYAILGERDPLQAAAAVVAGYHSAFPLEKDEIRILYVLIGLRLAVSVTNSAHRKSLLPEDPYVTVSEAPAWGALEKLGAIHPRLAHYRFRDACKLPAFPKSGRVQRWLASNARAATSILSTDLRTVPSLVFDLSVGSKFLSANPHASETGPLSESVFRAMKDAKADVGVGRYDEARLLYTSSLFGNESKPIDERRTIHLGIDLFAPPGEKIHAPLNGVVHALAVNAAPLDYGPVAILRHATGEDDEFFTLYGHLARATFDSLKVGQHITRGQHFANIGDVHENGGWPPHLHFQIVLDLLDLDHNFPGVARASQRGVWTSLSPDPNLLLGIPSECFPHPKPDAAETLSNRHEVLGRNLSVSYRQPLKIVRGWMQYLYDETGRAYLDAYNNVPLVGHSHPRVVRAIQKQVALLNTNTRYLDDTINRYAERLSQLLPKPLGVCYFVNSGSEANELALRLARAHTGREDVIVLEHAYHGNTNTLIDISPYKFNGPGGGGRKPWVHVAPIPDDYRGLYRRGVTGIGGKYADHVAEILTEVRKEGRGVAAFIAETLPSVAGQIVFPPNYLAEVYRRLRAAGGVCIADEVQVGFGRLGTHLWGFETQDVVPDIVVFGKPIGNAFPLAAVVTTAEVAESFDNGMEYFSTFGGNPIACAAGLAVLDVLRDERLQENAHQVGSYLLACLRNLQSRYALIGDVRGVGLFLGLDLVLDHASREPAPAQAAYVVNRLRERGVLTGTDGPHHNVIKLRPPLIFSQADADIFLETLDEVLKEDGALPRTD